MLALDKKPARIVHDVAYPGIELSFPKKYLIIVVDLIKDAMTAILSVFILMLTLFIGGVLIRAKCKVIMSTAYLEAVEYLTQGAGEVLCDKENAMEVVRHELKGDAFHLRYPCQHPLPVLDDGLAEGAGQQTRSIGSTQGLVHVANHLTEEWPPSFHTHCDQIDLTPLVVVVLQAPVHGGDLRSGVLQFFLQRLFVHRQSLFLRFFAKIRQKEIGDKDCGQKFREEREKRKEKRERERKRGEREEKEKRKKGKERKGRKKKRKGREGKGRQEKERQGCAGFSLMLLSSIVQNRANQRQPLC